MKSIYLFPNKLKIPALVIFLLSCIVMIVEATEIYTLPEFKTYVFAIVSDDGSFFNPTPEYSSFIINSITDEIIECMFFVGGLVLAFSKEKIEDEMITYIRLKSLVYSTYFSFSLLILNELLVYGFSAFYASIIFYYAFVLFLNIFYYTKLFIYKKQFSYENED
ncbi:hypothetical protein NU10_10375 [Flavobacterium dauae]|uniref:hypothetical protein n=1 Tax=Flavobacterium dauae TaxID=1563479 RepID=UPI00101B489A|nr:hypothetical protein [Flavobacterium dauae]WLD23111.1 hypothetical protein NU10_10375 [Flavobacterium dauae]